MTKQLTSGIDTLVIAIDVKWKNDIFFKLLQGIKERAFQEDKDCPGVIKYRDDKEKWLFSVRPYGIRGYEWFLTSKDFSMRIGNWIEPQSRPSIMVEITSEALWRVGAKEIYERIIEIIDTCGGLVVTAKISRVDLCMDLLMDVIEWDDVKLRKERVCRGRKIGIHLDGDILETFSIGIGDIRVRLYDKIREIKQVSKKNWMFDIWKIKKSEIGEDQKVIRVEFQIRREIIKQLGAGSADDFFRKVEDVWAYCTKEWLEFKDNPEREHKYRNTVPWWQVVQENFLGVQDPTPAIREKAIKIDKEQLISQLRGFASSLTALEMEERFIDPMNFKEIEPCMIKVIENQKLTGDRLNEFKENVIRKRAKYSRSKIGRNDPCICGSGKKYKKCCLGNEDSSLGKGSIDLEKETKEKEIDQMLFGEGLEDLTEELIGELVKKGWKNETLLFLKDRGGMYCRERNTILDPDILTGS